MRDQTEIIVETRGLCFTYQEGSQALFDIDMKIHKGEFVALLASNGSGKTTLIKNISGLVQPSRGDVLIDKEYLQNIEPKKLYSKMGIVFQNPDEQLFAPTVAEDVAFGPRNMDLPDSEINDRVNQALDHVGALKLKGRAIHHLSFGEKKRVCLAGILAMEPSILILDEPTAGLDPHGEDMMMTLLSQLNKNLGVTVVLATHSIDTLPLFADHIFVLKNGAILKNGDAEEIFCDQEMLQQASLRLPYISSLLHEMKHYDGVPINGLPLTIGEARKRMLELIPEEILAKPFDETVL